MKAKDYIADWLDKKYAGAKDLDGWTPEDVMQFADDFADKKQNTLLKKVLTYSKQLQKVPKHGRFGDSVRQRRTAHFRALAGHSEKIGQELETILTGKKFEED